MYVCLCVCENLAQSSQFSRGWRLSGNSENKEILKVSDRSGSGSLGMRHASVSLVGHHGVAFNLK